MVFGSFCLEFDVSTVQTITRENGSRRYHALDALRAWAMALGLVLHAAWIMVPEDAGAPRIDASANHVTEYICLAIHTFRMQLFFVLAGVFACLLVRKRGLRRFAANRFQRIAVPLVLFWLILCPTMMYQYFAAGIDSGSILGDVSAWKMMVDYMASVRPNNIMLLHLWFIYYLLLAYGVWVAIRVVWRILDRSSGAADWFSTQFRRLLQSPLAVFLLAIPFAIPMMWMKGPWGIEVGFDTLAPRWPGLITYTMYLIAGWMIFRNIDALDSFLKGWRWQLGLGLILTLPYFAYETWVVQNGYATHDYPKLAVSDIQHRNGQPDYQRFRETLTSAGPDSIAGTVFESLPDASRELVAENTSATQDQLKGLLVAINNNVLAIPGRFDSCLQDDMVLSPESVSVLAMPLGERSVDQTMHLNREILQSGFVGVIHSEDIHRPHYWLQRAGYCYGYSLITWALILGLIGLFQNHFDFESPFSRYFSDASYWFYLMHLPIQFQILNWTGDAPWHPAVKFSLYVFGTAAVLVPSYHFFVRPTWIGWLLNGRRYVLGKTPEGPQCGSPEAGDAENLATI